MPSKFSNLFYFKRIATFANPRLHHDNFNPQFRTLFKRPKFKAQCDFVSKISKAFAPTIRLSNGKMMPQLGLGTWQSAPGEVEPVVYDAIALGYRLIDCAMVYDNEREVGKAIKKALDDKLVRREDLFITTKLWNTFHTQEVVAETCKKSLENLGLSYLDLYLIHWPIAQEPKPNFDIKIPFKNAVAVDYDYVNTWKGMEECVAKDFARSIGVSNFNANQVIRIIENCAIKPVINQIEVNLLNSELKMIRFCRERGITVMGYSPLGSPKRPWFTTGDPVIDLRDARLLSIAEKHKKTVAQVLFRQLIQNGVIPIPKTVKKERLVENINVFDFSLTEIDMKVLNSFNKNYRSAAPREFKGMPYYPFDKW